MAVHGKFGLLKVQYGEYLPKKGREALESGKLRRSLDDRLEDLRLKRELEDYQ